MTDTPPKWEAFPSKPIGGADLPDDPPFPFGEFNSVWSWSKYMKVSALNSALRTGALSCEARGPRGGKHYAANRLYWLPWLEVYRARSGKYAESLEVNAALNRLGIIHACVGCKHMFVTGFEISCNAGAAAKKLGVERFRRNKCRRWEAK